MSNELLEDLDGIREGFVTTCSTQTNHLRVPYSHLCSHDHSPTRNLQLHLHVVIPQKASVELFSVVFSPRVILKQLLCHPNTSPKINLRKIKMPL